VKRPCGESADGKLKNAEGDLWVGEYIGNQIASRCEQKTRTDFLSLHGSDLLATRVIEAKWKQRAALITLTGLCFLFQIQSNLF
jgi:streptogramin lyase